MGFDPTNAIEVGIGITAFVSTITAVFLFLNAWNEKLARTLGYIMSWFAVWGWLGFAYHLTDNLEFARDLRTLSIIGQTLAQTFSVQYLFLFLSEKRALYITEKIWYWVLMAGHVFFLLLLALDFLLGTQFIVGSVGAEGAARLTPQPGPALLWFFAFYILFIASIAWIMTKGVLLEHGRTRRGNLILTLSIVGGYALGGIGFLNWYGITGDLAILRGFGIPLFVVAAFYTITNYRLFNLRVAAAEVFVFAMWGFVFWRVLLNESLVAATPDIILLLASIGVGMLFIRSITHELSIRIKLEDVSARLHVLNTSLESEVEKRTHELMQAKKHTDDVVEHLPVGLIEILEDTTVVRCNEVANEILNLGNIKILNTRAITHPQILFVIGEKVVPGVREVRLKVRGREIDVETTIEPLELETGSGHIIIIRDVTERRALERAKNDFVATAAHQLRTPLSAIKWTFELLSTESLTKAQKEVLDRGSAGVKNMMNIAEGLLMSIRTSEGISEFKFADTNFGEVLQNAADLVASMAKNKNVDLSIKIPDSLPVISMDKKRMVSATQIILDNAIRYTPEGGSVTLSAQLSEDGVVVSVKDTGIGISEEDQQHLFERFFRAKDAVETATDGSGLGLSIAKSVIEAHGGTLSVESEKGSGSVFSYRVPTNT